MIKKLPESLIQLIAAGEVVERPASVLKEILENSIDASAKHLQIWLKGAGRELIQLTDDGHGMSPEDAKLALERHATSKLGEYSDLETLKTFGFRGEAIPSISAISHFEIQTRLASSDSAWKVTVEGGKLLSESPCAHPVGTTLKIENLFFNTPARLKFLKRDTTERQLLIKTAQEVALAHPGIGMHLTSEDKTIWKLSPHHSIRERALHLWGEEWTRQMMDCSHTEKSLSIDGLINQIPSHQATRVSQYLFVNGRPIQHRAIQAAVYEAYREWLPVGRHPMYLLFLTVDPKQIDVNVHPTKREIRFSDERLVRDAVFYAIRQALKATAGENERHPTLQTSRVPWSTQTTASSYSIDAAQEQTEWFSSTTTIVEPDIFTKKETIAPKFFSQFQKVYLLAEWGDELLMMDQHAASERWWYEKLMKQAQTHSWDRQILLTPHLWNVTPDFIAKLAEGEDAFKRFGMVIEPMGSQTVAIKETPSFLKTIADTQSLAETLLIDLQEHTAQDTSAWHATVARAACRAAIMAGDSVSIPEMEKLWEDLMSCERPQTCPHGRPTYIRFPLTDFHKQFRRI